MIRGKNAFIGGQAAMIRRVKSGIPDIRKAVVTGVFDGKAVLQFDEDDAPSQKTYRHVHSYSPAVGDRVMLVKGIIIGGW